MNSNFEQNVHLGNEKPTEYESDYRANYLEHPVNPSNEEIAHLEMLQEKLRKTNLELENLATRDGNVDTIYREDYQRNQLEEIDREQQTNHRNLQKTNFVLGHLTSEDQRQAYQSESNKNFTGRQNDQYLQNEPHAINTNLQSKSA